MSEDLNTYEKGINLLRQGKTEHAIICLKEVTKHRNAGSSAWFALSIGYRQWGSHTEALNAINKALRIDSNDITLLVYKADLHVELGSEQEALPIYRRAIEVGDTFEVLPDQLQSSILQAHRKVSQITQSMFQYLDEILGQHSKDKLPSRFNRSIDLIKGKINRFEQQPRAFFYPELPCREFYHKDEFSWASLVESNRDMICKELQALMASETFLPYMQSDHITTDNSSTKLVNNNDWSAFHLIKNGKVDPIAKQYCPNTLALFDSLPLPRVKNFSPMLVFSKLKAGAKIPPHCGYYNTRLIAHLPITSEPGCYLRVGGQTESVKEGKLIIFNDSIEHEAWNDSQKDRVVLIFDIWRPELLDSEKEALASLFSSLNLYKA
ncbi:hypothetical protein GTQ48_04440 [Alteromonas genovensis]|uniref:Aspartyl/asparaginy/proline hydroxylase domain-containing protein n=1 Tax=Alteromonas genovensis TaxID=471225 RepID=A0A6N9TJA2_9ALTE|nr:aspartyl/asparaginyl beta-hydroxylase domain-containing protein [Alteromonas genovensis]NDW14778.1 hypothetical protein [Alteromonas genovensis]